MPKSGIANLPLHYGKTPRWLFKRMVLLSKAIVEIIIYEYGVYEFLRKISDPYWFQALSCVLGYDFHSSGTTTVTCGALKEAINPQEFGFAIAGGKGKASRKTPDEINKIGELYNLSATAIKELIYTSRIAAKIDNTAIQDGYNLYHHVLIFSEKGKWAIVQQGLNSKNNYARRYHWNSEHVENFVCEPHNAIICNDHQENVLDMTSKKSRSTQKMSIDLVNDNPQHLKYDWAKLSKHENQQTLDFWLAYNSKQIKLPYLNMPRNIDWQKMKEIYDFQPKNYEELLAIRGVGPKTVRALALISDLIYGEKPSWKDPVKYTFTVGGKDGVPYPVDKKTMDESIDFLKIGIESAKIGSKDKIQAIRRLHSFISI